MKTIRCRFCGRAVSRKWWQRGFLQPMPYCPSDDKTCAGYGYRDRPSNT